MRQLIVFGEDWGAHPSSTQHLISSLCSDVDVIWINSIGLRRPKLHWRDALRVLKKLTCRFRRPPVCTAAKPSFPIIHPIVIPLAQNIWLKKLNRWLLSRQVSPHLNTDHEVIIWTSLPSAVDYQGCFGEARWWYYCGDDFTGLAGVDHRTVYSFEQQLLTVADKVWVASEVLVEKFAPQSVELLEHGVDTHLFQSLQTRPADLPPKGPIAGFYGAIAQWLDQEFLVALAQLLPDWTFVFIGRELVETDALREQPNVVFLGEKPHHKLAGYVQHWDVSLLPFKNNDQIRACNPLKLKEYLATGTPILSTPFPALDPYQSHISQVENAPDAAAALVAELKTPLVLKEKRKHARQGAVVNNGWDTKANQVRKQLSASQISLQNENANCASTMNQGIG